MIEEIKIDRLEELIHEMMIKIRNTSVTNSAEGNPIEIENAAAAPLLKCASAITGIQDLHGYDKPWAGGEGKNKLNPAVIEDNYSLTTGGLPYVYVGRCATTTPIDVSEYNSVTVSFISTVPSTLMIYSLFSNNVLIARASAIVSDIPLDVSGADQLYLSWYSNSDNVEISDLSDIMLEVGSTHTLPYEPYSNICPITAFSTGSVEVEDEDEQSTTYAATFSDPIYQGSIDYVAKKTTATWGYIASYDGETLPGLWISDRDEYAAGTTPTTGAEVAYELASAAVETVTVSNAPISAVHGYNKIESSTGDMEVTYITEDFEPLVPTT